MSVFLFVLRETRFDALTEARLAFSGFQRLLLSRNNWFLFRFLRFPEDVVRVKKTKAAL
jgi:hypothetical protein